MQLIPYLTFNGNCEEALHFYETVFNGEITSVNRYEGAPMPMPPGYENKILHASLQFEGNTIMLCDAMPGSDYTPGNNYSLSVNIPQVITMDALFYKLAQGGTITMPLQDTFWGARFGMIKDKFGMNWMFNCDLN